MSDEDEDLQCWGWTDLSSYSSTVSDLDKEQQIVSVLQTKTMSRLSLRLDDSLLDRSLPHGSTSFTTGGGSWRSSRSLKPRRSQQHSVSCSESLLVHTPRKPTIQSLHNSSAASDASLLSSLLDESSIQDHTLVDTLWGLDHDIDPKESTIIAEQSTAVANSTLIGSDNHCAKHPVQELSRVYCKDCNPHSDRKESVTTCCPSTKYTTTSSSSSLPGMGLPDRGELETPTIYCRDRSRKRRTDVLQLGLDWSVWSVNRAAVHCSSALTRSWQVFRKLVSNSVEHVDSRHGAQSSHRGVMDLKDSSTNLKAPHPNRSLSEPSHTLPPTPTGNNKRRQATEIKPSSSPSWSSVALLVLELIWSATVFTASRLFRLSRIAAIALWPHIKKMYFASLSAGLSAGKTAGEAFKQLRRRWHHMTPSAVLTRFPQRLLFILLPLLLLLCGLCWFGPAGLQSVLSAVNPTQWSMAVSSGDDVMSSQSQSAESVVEESTEVQPYMELSCSRPQPPESPSDEKEVPAAEESSTAKEPQTAEEPPTAEEVSQLIRLEQSLAVLWERVEAGGRRAEQRHREVLRLYANLQQKASAQSKEEAMDGPWLSSVLDHRLSQLRRQLDRDRQQRDQARMQDLLLQQSQTSRLDQLELQLQTLAAKMEEQQWRRDAATTVSSSPTSLAAAGSVGVDRQSHDALLAEVARLEASLEEMRQDVKGLSTFRGSNTQLDRIQQMISAQLSAQVREDVRALVYGNQLTAGGDEEPNTVPESLLQWLSQQYVSGADLQATLASLELRIMQNVGLQLKQHHSQETVREAEAESQRAGVTVSQQDVHDIVQKALRLFSQDRTGQADYALESGGGSILSTRCSQTYETKSALLSLFGVPLWYFSQSPRAVIQPDIHPGNCWAFRGSTGFLVIRLSMRILPTAFSLEHIPKALAPSGALHSAPRDFHVYGLDNERQERGKLLGAYTFDEDGEALQTYPVTEENEQTFQIIEVQVLSNWGHQDYTCMYRFRVHGRPTTLEDAI